MAERSSSAREQPAREGKEQSWLFLRTLVGLLVVGALLPVLFVPPQPLVLLVGVAVLWLLSTVAAWWLVLQDGFERLAASSWYAPGLPHAKALVAFVLLAAVLKVAGTVAVDELVRGLSGYVAVGPREPVPAGKTAVRNRPYSYDLAVSLFALVAAYLAVYRGALAWLLES